VSLPGRRLPEPARAIAVAVTDAVAAAAAHDEEGYEEAAARLAGLNPEQVGVVLGAVVRSLLEALHPDGLTGDDLRGVLERCARSAAGWLPGVDATVFVVLLTGALGVHGAEGEQPAPGPREVARHAPVLVADLVAASGRPLADCLREAFAEVALAETMELP
jgi:hypothetical protein